METLDWIRDLVKSEQKMEETGMVELQSETDRDKLLVKESVRFLSTLKQQFVDASSAFNNLKGSAIGRIKIYGVAKTHADFMLFRNGYKMIFSLSEPGYIRIRFNFIGSNYIPTNAKSDTASIEEDMVESRWGHFGELEWTFKGEPVKIESMVRYYLSRFIRESAS